jgi:hypothetical protein
MEVDKDADGFPLLSLCMMHVIISFNNQHLRLFHLPQKVQVFHIMPIMVGQERPPHNIKKKLYMSRVCRKKFGKSL